MSSPQQQLETLQERHQQAQMLQNDGKPEAALEVYRAILETDDRDLPALHQMAQICESRGEFDKAIAAYQKAIEVDEESPFWVYRHLGFSLSQMGDLDGAIEAYEQALVRAPEDVATYGLLGQAQGKAEKLEEAISSYQKAIEIQPEQPFWLYFNLGGFLTRLEQFEPGILAYREASRLEPENPGIYRLLGETQSKFSDFEGAIESYQKAIAINPRQPADLYENFGDALLASNRKYEALEAYRSAVETQPNLPSARQKIADLLSEKSEPNEDLTMNAPVSQPMQTESQHAQLYHQATEILNNVPEGIPSSSPSLSIADLELSPDRIEQQVRTLKNKLNAEHSDRVVDGVLNELAGLQLSVENIEFQLKVITSHLLMPDRLLPGCAVSGTQAGTRLEIDAEFPLPTEQGFYPLEYNNNGVPFRWTGPGAFFYFDVFVQRQQKSKLELQVINTILDKNVDNLRCFVDNVEVSLSHHRAKKLYSFQGVIPAFPSSGSSRISFLIPNPVKTSDVYPETGDNRVVGVAFSKLIVQPDEGSEDS